ncbi:MAG: SpoIID/LytB domain-containing protein, partial [Candidatus Omnitrophica bacterium]|nr:SpoIID/LytB domain-containing protein [Candidatus Omnitrophota bacterium]
MFFSFLSYFLIFAMSFWPFGTEHQGPPLKKTSLELPRDAKLFQTIRISLGTRVPELTLETAHPFVVVDQGGRVLFRGDRIVKTRIQSSPTGIRMGEQQFSIPTLTIESLGDGLQVNGKFYRHAITVTRKSGTFLAVVNELLIEDYLKGVLPGEVNPKWPAEALKAQAVASRTFALFKVIEHQAEDFDLTKGTLSQVYGGKAIEHPITDRAVDDTKGEILTYKGKIFPAYFHSTCGGATTSAEYLWDVEPHPVLRGVECQFCRASKHYQWEARFTRKEIETKLRAQGLMVSNIVDLQSGKKDSRGRTLNFVIEDANGKKTVHANDFRLWLDSERLKSTLLRSIKADGDGFVFKGRGWGHGVGMCQYGNRALAELGYAYRDILFYYYPGAEI